MQRLQYHLLVGVSRLEQIQRHPLLLPIDEHPAGWLGLIQRKGTVMYASTSFLHGERMKVLSLALTVLFTNILASAQVTTPQMASPRGMVGCFHQHHGERQAPSHGILRPAYDPDQRREALSLFVLNTQRNPTDPNVWDSLGEADATDGQKDKAIECFKKSLSMDPPPMVRSNSETWLKQLQE